jgi:hypothetical protein
MDEGNSQVINKYAERGGQFTCNSQSAFGENRIDIQIKNIACGKPYDSDVKCSDIPTN